MDAKWIPYRISWHFALILELTCIDSLRDSDLDFRTLKMLGTQVFRNLLPRLKLNVVWCFTRQRRLNP